MTAPLWQHRDPCGCVEGAGHTCRPPWMTEDEWAGDGATPEQLSSMIKGTTTKRPGQRANAELPGLTSAKERL